MIYSQCCSCLPSLITSLLPPGKTTNNPKAHVPWAAIASDPDRFLDDKELPDDTTIVEISKMRSASLTLCYAKWLKAQKQGKVPFQFKDVLQEDKRDVSRKRSRETKSGAQQSIDSEAQDKEDDGQRRKIQALTSDVGKPMAIRPPAKADIPPVPVDTNDEPDLPAEQSSTPER